MTAPLTVAQRVNTLFERLFEVGPRQFRDDTRRGDLDRWDSLGHLTLVEALREEFGRDIPPELALNMDTVADIKRIMSALLESQPGR
jgi:acyl carrier protein